MEFQELSEKDKVIVKSQYESIFEVISNRSSLKSIDITKKILSEISLDSLFNGDLNQIESICRIFLQIGISSKMAAFGLTVISFLSETDKKVINSFIQSPENIIDDYSDEFADQANSKTSTSLQKENSKLKAELVAVKDEAAILKMDVHKSKEIYSSQYSNVINDYENKIDKLRYKLNKYVDENDQLKKNLAEHERNFSIEKYIDLTEELKLVRQNLIKLTNENAILKKLNDLKMNEQGDLTEDHIEVDKEYDAAILWENKIMDNLVYNLTLKNFLYTYNE